MTDDFVPTVKLCPTCQKLLLTELSLEAIKRKSCRKCKTFITRAENILARRAAAEIDGDGFKTIK